MHYSGSTIEVTQMKLLILILIGIVIYCLGSGMYYMVSAKKNPEKIARALTWRIVLSIAIFCLLILGFLFGWIVPHGIS
jgi:hypothetical protein